VCVLLVWQWVTQVKGGFASLHRSRQAQDVAQHRVSCPGLLSESHHQVVHMVPC
jgi:hypothetical protein